MISKYFLSTREWNKSESEGIKSSSQGSVSHGEFLRYWRILITLKQRQHLLEFHEQY